MSHALRDIRSVRASTWEDRAQHVRQLIVDCRPLIELLGPLTQVHIENHADRGVIEALTGQLHARFRYADHTRARIVRIDTSRARALPGILAVLTHEDVPDVRYGQLVKDRRLFAKEEVRFEGDVVAAVAATTPELAE